MNTRHTSTIREIAKFFSGLIFADIIAGLWFGSTQVYSSLFLGFPITQHFINIWIVLDVVLLLIVIHYAWHIKLPASKAHKTFYIIVGTIFAIVSVLHFLRIVYAVPLMASGVVLPQWISVIGTLITGFLSYASFHFAQKK